MFEAHQEPQLLASSIEACTAKIIESGGEITKTFDMKAFVGFAATFDESLRKEIESQPHVKYIGQSI